MIAASTLLREIGSDFYTGVPDSLLRSFYDEIVRTYGLDPAHHVIAANEGNAVGIAAGYHLATGKVPVIYLQNSGIGNTINPLASLMNPKVYGIPCILIVGWRGEPGVHDEPQHAYQGEVTCRLLEDMGIEYSVIGQETSQEAVRDEMHRFRELLSRGEDVAFVIRKGAISGDRESYGNSYTITREDAIRRILAVSGDDPIICTTGKAGRELYELREKDGAGHGRDFLSVGSMGHASSIALGVALKKPESTVWCIDGDGAVLMHMGAMAVIGKAHPGNLLHILLNNESHESVGGLPTAADAVNLTEVAKACGYAGSASVKNDEELERELSGIRRQQMPYLLEIRCSTASRSDLGRPKESPAENKKAFMSALGGR
jgi:phosphonopyruvate decarboxylase